jgi:hypothetical protein
MIATFNSDCSILTLTLVALESAANKTIDSIVLKSRLNCSLTESSLDVSFLTGSIIEGKIPIPAIDFYNDTSKTTFCDGVYYFKLEVTYTIANKDTFLVTDSTCVLSACCLKCKILDYYISTKNKEVWYYYYALLQGGDCDSCYCTDMCSLYTELKLLLNDNNIPDSTGGCGCT